MENKSNDMATKIFSLTPSEQQAKWDDIMGQMISFVSEKIFVAMSFDLFSILIVWQI
jgi:hypothetical protein